MESVGERKVRVSFPFRAWEEHYAGFSTVHPFYRGIALGIVEYLYGTWFLGKSSVFRAAFVFKNHAPVFA